MKKRSPFPSLAALIAAVFRYLTRLILLAALGLFVSGQAAALPELRAPQIGLVAQKLASGIFSETGAILRQVLASQTAKPQQEKLARGYELVSCSPLAAESAAARTPTIIGESMPRVEAAAAKIPGAKFLNTMPDFAAQGMNADQVTSAMMQYNRQWMLQQMRSGAPIIDIGVDVNRATPSIFYQMEQNMLKNYQILHPEFGGAIGQ